MACTSLCMRARPSRWAGSAGVSHVLSQAVPRLVKLLDTCSSIALGTNNAQVRRRWSPPNTDMEVVQQCQLNVMCWFLCVTADRSAEVHAGGLFCRRQ
jgi:hypothetical protein